MPVLEAVPIGADPAPGDEPRTAGFGGPEVAECPRCGYDLAGAIAAWPADACAVEGTCSECGLRFRWVDLFRDPGLRVPWLVESRGRMRFKTVRTLARALRPGRFWGVVPIALAVRVGVLIRLFLVLASGAHLAMGTLAAVGFLGFLARAGGGWGRILGAMAAGSSQVWISVGQLMAWPYANPWVWGVDVALVGPGLHLSMVVVFLVLTQTFARAKVRQRHLLRAVVYGLPVAALAGLALAVVTSIRAGSGAGRAGFEAWLAETVLGLLLVQAPVAWHWLAFTRRYLRLPHTGGVVLAASVVSLLLVNTVILILDF